MNDANLAIPAEYAWARSCCIPSIVQDPHRSLQRAWECSRRRLTAIAARLRPAALDPRVVTIALSGSLGRMEALDHSDADLIVVVQDTQLLELAERQAIMRDVWSQLDPLQLPRPAEDGIFAAAINRQALCDLRCRGQIDESPPVFGTRIQLLLDSQPVLHGARFDRLLSEILQRYASGDVLRRPTATWTYLANDLIRYYRCLGLDAQWRRRTDPSQWRLFNLKLAHSRRLLYAGLLFLLAESSTARDDRLAWLQDRLRLTPLERVAWVMMHNRARDLSRLVASYDQFLGSLQDATFRAALRDSGRSDGELEDNVAFAGLMSNSQQLASGLVDFVFSRRGIWSDEVLASLLL